MAQLVLSSEYRGKVDDITQWDLDIKCINCDHTNDGDGIMWKYFIM